MRRFLCALSLLMLAACSSKLEDRLDLAATEYGELGAWPDTDLRQAFNAFRISCDSILKMQDSTMIGQGLLAADASVWKPICTQATYFNDPTEVEVRGFFETNFTPFEASNRGKREGLFTGYFIPELRGSLTRHDAYQIPVYGVPAGLEKGEAYFSREEIESGAIANDVPILLWVDDAVDLFFTQIQGSGSVVLDNGQTVLIGYAAQNGHPYTAIGKVLIERDELQKENVSMDSIKYWLRTHPDQAQAVMNENASYVFFKTVDIIKGGAGVELTPFHSLAIDRRFIPYGLPLFVQATLPATDSTESVAFHQLLIAQDTGGAIKGPVRGDVFFGFGENAAKYAGNMKQPGTAVVLVPNALANGLK